MENTFEFKFHLHDFKIFGFIDVWDYIGGFAPGFIDVWDYIGGFAPGFIDAWDYIGSYIGGFIGNGDEDHYIVESGPVWS